MVINLDEVVTGALVNAISWAGRRISAAVGPIHGRRRGQDIAVARWFETFELVGEIPSLPTLAPESEAQLVETLRGDEIQAALQELLAARLTDAPERDAARARDVVRLTMSRTADAHQFAEVLVSYYDDQVCALVARLESDDPKVLPQIRRDAFATRMINILNAIERHSAVLSARPSERTEASFLASYRRHVIDQHGKLEPPDFDRRRRVPISDIFVPTTIFRDASNKRERTTNHNEPPAVDVFGLADVLDRHVVLGDPGGGKTTAANVLMHYAASAKDRRIPFLVTLRNFAAKDPPERSVAGYIEYTLENFYQCPPPQGFIGLLLLTGRAIVIFDGLDELLDTSRRADVTARVERFCAEYPLVPVLVTSRLVGYEQAKLDETQFTTYRLGGFGDEQVAEYVHKWFMQEFGIGPAEVESWTEAFLAESEAASDLRSNPLMLALLCILYRGAGSLPRNRADVYEQCAVLMFRRWDAHRRIYQDLRAGQLLEPALYHIAWWLFSRSDTRAAVTESELVVTVTKFLHGRGFEAENDARDAAREFVQFCRGRSWVFSDAGTSKSGERLYAFTHRTFLEYFAAAHLAYDSDTPEHLARSLTSRIARDEWWVIGELAVQIKDRTSTAGAQRIYATLLSSDTPQDHEAKASLLRFLALCLRSVDPSPKNIRALTRQILKESFKSGSGHLFGRPKLPWDTAVDHLFANCGSYSNTVAAEIDLLVTESLRSDDREVFVNTVRFAIDAGVIGRANPGSSFWIQRAKKNLGTHKTAVVTAADTDIFLRTFALREGLITVPHALKMRGGLSGLFVGSTNFAGGAYSPYLEPVFRALRAGWPVFGDTPVINDLVTVGEYILDHPEPPWLHGPIGIWDEDVDRVSAAADAPDIDGPAYLGAIVILAVLIEYGRQGYRCIPHVLGPLYNVLPYLQRRHNLIEDAELPGLSITNELNVMFREWAENRVDFIGSDQAAEPLPSKDRITPIARRSSKRRQQS
jgi:hypothetical protein